jgi:hypothetical protein
MIHGAASLPTPSPMLAQAGIHPFYIYARLQYKNRDIWQTPYPHSSLRILSSSISRVPPRVTQEKSISLRIS